ncbi:MAG: hypothetical protein CMO98_13935 [Woeseia sp.]|nr:hypothetical protein [Woeseia sp.]
MANHSEFHARHEDLTPRIYNGELTLPHRYVLVLTNICNLRCYFCFQIRDRRSDAMTADQWISFIDQMPDYARVTLTGGEPLAFKEFERVFRHVTRRHQCNMISNGILLSPKVIDLLLDEDNFKVLSISIDDIGNHNRDVRPAHWNRFVESIKYFHQRKKELGSKCQLDINTVVLDKNAHQLFEIHKYCVEVLKANTHAFQFLKGSDLQHADVMFDMAKIFEPSKAVTYAHIKEIFAEFEAIRRYSANSTCQAFVHPDICDLNGSTPVEEPEFLNKETIDPGDFQSCKFPWSSVHVNVDGHLFPCMAVSMGNVKDESLIDIVQGEKFQEFRRALSKELVQGCNRCGWVRQKDVRSMTVELT